MDARICSLETEYALVSNFLIGNSSSRDNLADQIESAIRAGHLWVNCNSFGRNAGNGNSQNLVQIREGQFVENGSRVYYDVGQFEWANPETIDPRSAVLFEKAAERNLFEAVSRVKEELIKKYPDVWIMMVKNNIDYFGNKSYGCHENYSLRRLDSQGRDIFARLSDDLVPFLVTRQIFCGSGRIGTQGLTPDDPSAFQISQRADFIEQLTSPQTRSDRSLLNLRDEPLADKSQWRRLHLILGDSNMSEFATFLKIGTTSLVLSAIEANKIHGQWSLRDPVATLHKISREGLRTKVRLYSGDWTTALAIQRWYWKIASDMVSNLPASHFGHDVLLYWSQILDDLEKNGEKLFQRVDWAIKKRNLFGRVLLAAKTDWEELGYWIYLINQTKGIPPCLESLSPRSWVEQHLQKVNFHQLDDYAKTHRLDWRLLSSQRELLAKLYELDFRYHDIDPQQGLYSLLENTPGIVERIITDGDEIKNAQRTPPRNTRAWQRGQLIRLSRDYNIDLEMDWDKIVLLQTNRIMTMPDPFLPTQIDTDTIFKFGSSRDRKAQPEKKIDIKIVKVENLEKH